MFSRLFIRTRPIISRVCQWTGQRGEETATGIQKTLNLCPKCPFPTPPCADTCCGSGCQECVWIKYANEVANYFDDHPTIECTENRWNEVHYLLAKSVPDVNLRTYLEMELKSKFFHPR